MGKPFPKRCFSPWRQQHVGARAQPHEMALCPHKPGGGTAAGFSPIKNDIPEQIWPPLLPTLPPWGRGMGDAEGSVPPACARALSPATHPATALPLGKKKKTEQN